MSEQTPNTIARKSSPRVSLREKMIRLLFRTENQLIERGSEVYPERLRAAKRVHKQPSTALFESLRRSWIRSKFFTAEALWSTVTDF